MPPLKGHKRNYLEKSAKGEVLVGRGHLSSAATKSISDGGTDRRYLDDAGPPGGWPTTFDDVNEGFASSNYVIYPAPCELFDEADRTGDDNVGCRYLGGLPGVGLDAFVIWNDKPAIAVTEVDCRSGGA